MFRKRLFLVCTVLIILVGLIWVLNIEDIITGPWSNLLSAVLVTLGVLFSYLQWIHPFSATQTFTMEAKPKLPIVRPLSGYKRRYCEYLFYQNRDFDVKGLSTQGIYTLDLNQIFVQLSIEPKAAHQTSVDPIQIPESFHTGGHSIWNYLASEQLANQHLVIIGPPGSGKTTLLKHIALTQIGPKNQRNKFRVTHKLPILLFLRDYADTITYNHNFSLIDAVKVNLGRYKHPMQLEWMERRLEKGRCLILLDGLDEVADSKARQQVVDWVERQMIAYGKNRFIVTSRPFGYRSNPLAKVTVLEVRSFTPTQVEQFVHNWYLANEIMSYQKDDLGVRMKAKDGADDLLQRLRDTPTLIALAVNPLLLTMIATVHRYRSSLPGKRVALYAEICEVFLGKRQEAKRLTMELSSAQKLRILQPLAFHMMLHKMREIPLPLAQDVIKEPLSLVDQQLRPEEFLQLIENTSGLLLEQEPGVYKFAHLTFQEYLAATYVREYKLENILVAQVEVSWWYETIRLYCAQADASPIIAECLTSKRPSVPALTLALECQHEALQVQPAVISQLDILLDQGVEDVDPERRRIIAEALLNRRLRQMVHLHEDKYSDTSLVTCGEYQVFLDAQWVRGLYYQPDHWRDYHFPVGQARYPVLGVRSSDAAAFCDWLTEREQGPWHYRLPMRDEPRKELLDEKITKMLKGRAGFWLDNGTFFVFSNGDMSLRESLIQEQFDYTRTLSRALVHDLELIRTFEKSHYLSLFSEAYEKAYVLAHDLNRARELSSFKTLDIALAGFHESACNLAISLAFQVTLIRDLNFAEFIHSITIEALTLVCSVDITRTCIRIRDCDLTRTYKSICDLGLTFPHDLAHDILRVRDLIRYLAHARAEDRSYAEISAQMKTLAFDLIRIFNSADILESHPDWNRPTSRNWVGSFFHLFSSRKKRGQENRSWQWSQQALQVTRHFDSEQAPIKQLGIHMGAFKWRKIGQRISKGNKAQSQRSRRTQPALPGVTLPTSSIQHVKRDDALRRKEVIQRIVDILLEIYVEILMLEKRIQGELHACEGILLMKDRRKEYQVRGMNEA